MCDVISLNLNPTYATGEFLGHLNALQTIIAVRIDSMTA